MCVCVCVCVCLSVWHPQVTLATQRNTMNGATESLGLPELLLMSVCWLENEQILTAIDQAVEQTREDLKTQVKQLTRHARAC